MRNLLGVLINKAFKKLVSGGRTPLHVYNIAWPMLSQSATLCKNSLLRTNFVCDYFVHISMPFKMISWVKNTFCCFTKC